MTYHHGNLKEELISSACKICELNGHDQMSLRSIAKEANVSQTAPYRHFKTKESLLAEVSKPEYQANLPFYITSGPTNRKAYEITTAPKALIESLPSHPKNVPLMLPVSLDFYAKNRTEAIELYMELMSE